MIEGSLVEFKMLKVLKKGMMLDKNVYTGRVDSYDSQDEKFLIQVAEECLTKFQLDAKYEAKIYTEKKTIACEGMIKERYQSEDGNQIQFFIENGFYKVLS